MTDTNTQVKQRFGEAFRAARDKKQMSRASLAIRLGISPKTIQSWEMGRTFIEHLALIPEIEHELEISISRIIEMSVNGDQESKLPPLVEGLVRKGPLPPTFNLQPARDRAASRSDKVAHEDWVMVPVVSSEIIENEIADLYKEDVERQVLIPAEWVPRGGVLVATRMNDGGLEPRIFLGDTIIVDCRPVPPDKNIGQILAFSLAGRGLRIRQLHLDCEERKLIAGGWNNMRSRMHYVFQPDKGSRVVGRVVAVLSQI